MAPKKLLITGATGKQGRALIDALLQDPSNSTTFTIYALTRNASSASARALAAKNPNIHLIEGNTTNPAPVFAQLGPSVHGVFSVSLPGPTEETQGTALIDAAAAAGVKHFIYTSVDRGGPARSETDATPVPHFGAKFNVEKHLKAKAAESGGAMAWTILRPVAFYDNLTPDFFGRCFARFVQQMGDRKLQLVGTKDIGRVAAGAFLEPEKYANTAVTLAGDELSFEEISQIFREEMGYDLPLSYGFVASLIKRSVGDLGVMFKWFEDVGYGADIPQVKKEFPFIQDFKTWLRNSSKFEKRS